MGRVYSHPQLVVVTQIKDLLQRAGIDAELRNEYAAGAAGELSPIDAWPELWVRRERDRERALSLIENFRRRPELPDWECPECGSDCPDAFEFCWHCGAGRKEHRQV